MTPAEFASRCDPAYLPARHHHFLSALTARAIRQGGARVIINMPPRHGKSRLFAVETALWEMAREPQTEVVVASYALSLAVKHSREARQRLDNERWQQITGLKLNPSHSTADDWEMSNGSTYKAIGVDGGLSGFGADLTILDDLHKDAAEANSETMRNRVWDWIESVVMARITPATNVILIGTRWHQDDSTARFLRTGEKWLHLNLPGLAGNTDPLGRKPGEALWPERFPADFMASRRAVTSRYFWNALYDGNPITLTGNHLDVTKFVHETERPKESDHTRFLRFWDLAVTAKTQSDYSVGALCAIDGNGEFWICDIARQQSEWPKVRNSIVSTAHVDRCQVGIESVGTQGGLCQNLREVFPDQFALTECTVEKDKLTRALPWFALVNSGKVHLIDGPWTRDFIDECQAFPLGEHDDQVDAVSGAYAALGGTGQMPVVFEDPRRDQILSTRAEMAVSW